MTTETNEAPAWLEVFAANLASTFDVGDFDEQAIGWIWAVENTTYELMIYPNLIEVEGEACARDIVIDIKEIFELFDSYEEVSLAFNCADDLEDLRDALSILGRVAGNDVLLRVVARPPDEHATPTGRVLTDGTYEVIEP